VHKGPDAEFFAVSDFGFGVIDAGEFDSFLDASLGAEMRDGVVEVRSDVAEFVVADSGGRDAFDLDLMMTGELDLVVSELNLG